VRSTESRFLPRGCYELAQEWFTHAENWGPMQNQSNREIRIPMRFLSRVHNALEFPKRGDLLVYPPHRMVRVF
jgi:hypothetical protein